LVLISRTKTDEEREFYLRHCVLEKFSVRELERQISSGVFKRVIMGNETISSSLKEIHPDVTGQAKKSCTFTIKELFH
jgi:predicted nuclease of restriction endonuclease-like (RecB) superfamily